MQEQDYLSDESDFHGSPEARKKLEDHAASFSVREYWQNRSPSLMEIAEANIMATISIAPVVQYNPYADNDVYGGGRRLSETVEEFLHRLPPARTPLIDLGSFPWICIANPFYKAPKHGSSVFDVEEGTAIEDFNGPVFVREGQALLQKLTSSKHNIERDMSGKPVHAITRAVNSIKNEIVKNIMGLANNLHCIAGKWLLFCSPDEVNDVWAVIAKNTANNELGLAAKVAPDNGDDRKARLICIYTKDFTDLEDVTRVCKRLKSLGVIDKPIHYKCEAYTKLGLERGNQYGIKPSMYSSTDILKPRSHGVKEMKQTPFAVKIKSPRILDDMDWEF